MTRETDMTLFPTSPRHAFGALILTALLLAVAALALTAPASAATAAPGWTIHSTAIPTRFSSEESAGCPATISSQFPRCDAYQVTATNAGSVATAEGAEIVLEDTLPAGLTVQKVSLFWNGPEAVEFGLHGTDIGFLCSTSPVRCSFPFRLQPDETLELIIFVTVDEPNASGTLTNSATVSGGAPTVSTTMENPLGGPLPAFGAASVSSYVAGADGQPDTQAGDHPYEFTTRIDLNSAFKLRPDAVFGVTSVEDPKNVVVDLPLGFLGSALATPTCTFAQLSSHVNGGVGGCPTDTVIGHIFTEPINGDSVEGPIYNMVPEHGVAAEFGFVDLLAGAHVLYASVAPTSAGYVLRTTAPEVPQIPLTDIVATFFGNPAAKNKSGTTPVATFTNPSDCSAQSRSMAVHMDSWQHPGGHSSDGTPDLSGPGWTMALAAAYPGGPTGCNLLQFNPTMSVQPETTVPGAADSPAGLSFDLKLAQFEDPSTLATPPLRDASVTLPQGLTVDPSAAGGLAACSEQQVGFKGYNSSTGTNEFTAAEPSCPDASKVATVELTTPLLASTLRGAVYLAKQYENPFGSLLAGYIVVDDPDTGTIVKIPGELKADEGTGQITGVFKNNPQFPFTELKLHFKGGPRGALATPENCGTFTTTSAFTPWSAPDSGPAATPSDSFQITTGCVSGFAPTFTAGTTNTRAGGYSSFVLSFSRSDTDQELSGLSVTLPPGLLAKVAGVALCSDAQVAAAAANPSGAAEAANPSCPSGSQIGTVQAAAGPGPSPFFASGKAYLTGPYKGEPYGVVAVVPAIAGPFDLGTVVVRASLHIDPTDGHVTAVSDSFPTIVKGIPLRVRRVDVTLDRPNFAFNPTSCAAMAISGTLSSTGGLSAATSAPFQASGCQELPFKPSFKASTQGHTSKANGASLTVTVAEKSGEANIRKVNLALPLALPSRLTTLQKACTEAQFNANPAGCPEASNVGTATAVTPVLNVPLTGPAYLVSHGSAAFPDLEFVLQGENVKIVLDGKTDIKKGITYSKFETVPDAPVSSFTTVLPEGPHSILAANGNLCANAKVVTVKKRVTRRVHGHPRRVTVKVKKSIAQPLLMPTTITGQNGAVVTQSTKIAVSGCTKPHTKAKPKRARHGTKTHRRK
jgi:uncharacterized repeat protein (TIGR01451 family)